MSIGTVENAAEVLCAAHTSRAHSYQRFLAVVFIVSFSLDFKGTAGGSLIQYLMAVVNTGAFALLAVSYRVVLPRRGLGAFLFWGWALFLVTGSIGAVVNAIPFGHYIRIGYPFVLFLEGLLVVWWVGRDSRDAEVLVLAMGIAAVVSVFFTAWWGFHFTGEGLGEIRYQVLSPLIPFVIVTAGYDWFFARRRRLSSIFLLGVTLGLIGISVTRGAVLVVGFVGVVVLLSAFGNSVRSGRFPRPIVHALVWAPVVGLVGFAAFAFLYPDTLSRWVHRSLGAGHTATFWTRVAAVIGQYESLMSTPFGWLTGRGFGSSYPWPTSDFPWILRYLGANAKSSAWFPGEFMWMPFLYYGGFVAGLIAELALLAGAVRAFQFLGTLLRTHSWRNPEARPAWIGVLGCFVFLGMGFTANPFILRLAALFLGLCVGLTVSQRRLLRSVDNTGMSAGLSWREKA